MDVKMFVESFKLKMLGLKNGVRNNMKPSYFHHRTITRIDFDNHLFLNNTKCIIISYVAM